MKDDINTDRVVKECIQKLIDGWSVRKVRDMLYTKYECDKNEADNVIGLVKQNLKSMVEDDKDIAFEVNIEKLSFLYEHALMADNMKLAKDIVDVINKMIGAYTTKVEGNLNVNEFKFKFGD